MELRVRRYRAACFAILALALASVGSRGRLVVAGAAGRRLRRLRRRRPLHARPAATRRSGSPAPGAPLPLLLAGAVIATGGADQPGPDVVRAARGHPRRPLRAARAWSLGTAYILAVFLRQHRRPSIRPRALGAPPDADRRRRADPQHRDPLRRPGRVRPRPPPPLDPRPADRPLQPQRARAAPGRAGRRSPATRGGRSRTPCCSATSTTSSGSTTSSATPPATRSCRTSPTRCGRRCAPATRSTGSAARRSSSSCPAPAARTRSEIAERLRHAVRERRPVGVEVTISIGVAVSEPRRRRHRRPRRPRRRGALRRQGRRPRPVFVATTDGLSG